MLIIEREKKICGVIDRGKGMVWKNMYNNEDLRKTTKGTLDKGRTE